MKAELADGRVLEFPDGTDPAVVQATVKKVLGGGAKRDNEIPGGITPDSSKAPPEKDESLWEKAKGAGEAALTTATGATTGALGTVAGTAQGITNSIREGTFGTQAGVDTAEKAATEGGAAGTYAPRTAKGQEYASDIGKAAQTRTTRVRSGDPPMRVA